MPRGADDRFWKQPELPSVFKHTLLDKYVPQFAGMTGSRAQDRRVVFLDGYAGRGRYQDGSPGSAERILRIAQQQSANGTVSWTCYFVERDEDDAAQLATVVDEYARQGVQATAHRGVVLDVLNEVVRDATNSPLFLFLDPCGLGVPYERLVELLRNKRRTTWPPTEILLNFSLAAVRRIGGHVGSQLGSEASQRRLDQALGGPWWRAEVASGVTTEAVAVIASTFCQQLSRNSGMELVSVPVRREPTHQPLYHLVFGTRSPYGLWVFGDSVAQATQAWWDTIEQQETQQTQLTLFPASQTQHPSLDTVKRQAIPTIAHNLEAILQDHASFRVVDHTRRVFGSYYGQVRETVVRDAIKLLYQQRRTSSTGVGGKGRDLVVARS
jgi:three-Cys-motif partner protein